MSFCGGSHGLQTSEVHIIGYHEILLRCLRGLLRDVCAAARAAAAIPAGGRFAVSLVAPLRVAKRHHVSTAMRIENRFRQLLAVLVSGSEHLVQVTRCAPHA